MTSVPTTNSLGLDFNALEVSDPTENTSPTSPATPSTPHREKRKPYVNPDRVKTGGPQREKLTDEELVERMARIKEQNEKIKQRRMDVEADEAAFLKSQEVERQKMERTKKIQDNIDKTREQNVKRKMFKVQNREWDSGKPTVSEWKGNTTMTSALPTLDSTSSGGSQRPLKPQASSPSLPGVQTSPTDHWARGTRSPQGGRGKGRGRGRGRGRTGQSMPRSVEDGAKIEELAQEDEQANDSEKIISSSAS